MKEAQERADFWITYCVRAGMLWGLKNAEGWRLLKPAGGGEAFPAWATREEAQAQAAAGEEACALSLNDWMKNWLPGLERDGRPVALSPLGEEGVLIGAADLLEELELELEDLGG